MKELRQCDGCDRYFWVVVQPHVDDNLVERLKFCEDCLHNKFMKPTSLTEIERENTFDDMPEKEKQAENSNEPYERFRRYNN